MASKAPATNPPSLVWPDGRPLKRETLSVEIAKPEQGSVRTIHSGHPAQGLDPRKLAALLLSAEQGDALAYFELAEEMEEKDLHYLSVMGTRKRAVAQLPIEVEAADDSEEAKADAKLVEDWLERDMIEAELFDVLDAIGKGVSSTEIVWELTSESWLPKALKWRDPRWFEFDRTDGETLYLRGNMGPEELPAAKFITHFHPAKSGLPIRGGMARAVAWGYMFKNFAIKDWVVFLEAYGHPVRIGKYGPNESEENKRILERALRALGTDAAAAFPETMSVEFIDRKAGTAPNDLWRSHAEYFDEQISKAVLGQTNTTDAQSGGLGSGQANVHNEVRQDIERADAKLLAATLNRDLIVPLVMLNRGPRKVYPRLKIGRPDPVDVEAMVKSAEALAGMGVAIDGEELRERAGLPAAKDPAKALKAPGATDPAQDPNSDGGQIAAGSPVKGNSAVTGRGAAAPDLLDPLKSKKPAHEVALASQSNTEAEREPDFIALTADEALSDWEPIIENMLSSVEDVAADCSDLSELQSRMAEALGGMGVDAFTELLAKGGFAARVTGLADPKRDAG